MPEIPSEEKAAPRFVVIGAGFGGLEIAKSLGRAKLPVTVIDRRNHHLFQPLLYQVATAALSAPDIAEPIRRIVRRYPTARVLFGEVTAIDREGSCVVLDDGERIPYDCLVLAAGAQTSYFGNDGWKAVAPGLKSIEDARAIRSQILMRFEEAEREPDPQEQHRLITFAIIGGGPSGVELAGSIAELARYTLARDFRAIKPQDARILLVEAGDRILSAFSQSSSDHARERLERLGVHVMTNTRVTDVTPDTLSFGEEKLPVGLVLWAAGIAASPLAASLGAPTDRMGRVIVDRAMKVPGDDNIYAIGDLAHCEDENGVPLPGLAQVAKQQGQYLGAQLAAWARTGEKPRPFTYRSRGNTAIIGRHAAVFEQGRMLIKGWFAWLAWAIIHVYLLVGFQHRLTVSIQWLWRYLTYERGARLISREK